ncbi:alpha/beta hydrolase [Massilia sp. DJPM01]|uniref:alpha/beta fold hydrolase n=1 Tax=Massilia sp. DJPM01 TaxID=3024404 RepID=UPI00259E01C0|nr:alpha/beta hydrolase [Massilia sp. DJPM01]MDM5177578.1 alpha/beta hydrolase [Massilia sp. DJPM01]
MSALIKNNVHVDGAGQQAMLFAHGFGCDQGMWRYVEPAFRADYRTVLFDHVGAGAANLACYDPQRYDSLGQYADDVLDICHELALERTVFVGHAVSAMIGVLAAIKAPRLFSSLVLICPSPCYIDDGDDVGGFSRDDIDGLIDFFDDNFVAWSGTMAPVIMGNPERPELGQDLERSFCRTDPTAARQLARVTLLSGKRRDLAPLRPPALIPQSSADAFAPPAAGRYRHQALRGSTLVQLAARGHCPTPSAPQETVAAIRACLR